MPRHEIESLGGEHIYLLTSLLKCLESVISLEMTKYGHLAAQSACQDPGWIAQWDFEGNAQETSSIYTIKFYFCLLFYAHFDYVIRKVLYKHSKPNSTFFIYMDYVFYKKISDLSLASGCIANIDLFMP